jgi:hypothetical protein
MDILARRFDQQLAVTVPPHILSKEVEACFDMRHGRFLRREFQSAFTEEALNQRLYLILQQLFRNTSNDEVVGITD